MSSSSLSDGAPSEEELEQALRNAVREVYLSGDLDNLTVKRIRKSVEADLDLQDDFFKTDPEWKERSKNVIQSEVVRAQPIHSLLAYIRLTSTLRAAKQTQIPMVKSLHQLHLHVHLPKVRKHNRTCLNHKSRIGIFEELSAPPARMQDLTSVGRRKRLIQKALIVERWRYREKGPYPN